MRAVAASLAVLAVSVPAYADEVIDHTRSPGFVTLLRQDSNSRIGADMTYLRLDGDASGTLLRIDVHGHVVNADGVGGYAQVPITWVDPGGNSETALGGVEVGGIYIPNLSAQNIGLVMRAGITLPTVRDDYPAETAVYATMLRPVDLMTTLPRSSTLRLAASPMLRSGQFFARGDFGIDINLYSDGNETVSPALLVGGGAGIDLGAAAIMGELSMLALTGSGGNSFSNAALSLRGTGTVQPYGALLIPIDNDVRRVFEPSFLLGLEGRI